MAANWNKPRSSTAVAQRNAIAQRKAADHDIAGKDLLVSPKQRPQTLDARFAGIKENRMRVMSSQRRALHEDNREIARMHHARQQYHQQQRRAVRGGAFPQRWINNSAR